MKKEYVLWRMNQIDRWKKICYCKFDTPCCASREAVLPIGIKP